MQFTLEKPIPIKASLEQFVKKQTLKLNGITSPSYILMHANIM